MSKSDEIVNYKIYYNYSEKYRLPLLVPPSVIDELSNMDVRSDDIFICTYPKSGTHWMQELVHLILNDGDPTKLTHNHRRVVMEAIDRTDVELGCLATGTPNFELMSEDPSPRVFTTHLRKELLPQQIWKKRCPVIYVYRHPKDVITSWFEYDVLIKSQFPSVLASSVNKNELTFAGFEEYFRAKLHGICEYDAWFDHVLEYDSLKDNHNILYVSYEEMKTNLRVVAKSVTKFIGRSTLAEETMQKVLENATLPAMKKNFEELEKQHSKANHIDVRIFLGKGTSGRWKDYFSVRQSEDFDEIYRSKMKDCSITKIYDI